MSATTERLLEQIKLTEETLATAKSYGQVALIEQCEADLTRLRQSLLSANEALNEGKQSLLKG